MDELYGDLENYNEVYITEELQNENKQLKIKLEEYETAMGKLQKDYDKLALEFHNLQKNYSSLLKTARAEVERKTQTITQLNLANDMKILQSLKSGYNRKSQNNRSRFQKGVQNVNKADNLDVSKVENKSNDGQKPKKDESGSEMSVRNRESTSISVHISDKSKLNIGDNVVARVDTGISKGEVSENISQRNPKHEATKNIPGKIIDKRKSVSSDVVPKFSSEDESESGNPTSHETRSDNHTVINHVNTGTRVTHDSASTKTSDTSSIDTRCYNIQDEPRHNNRNRMSRDYEHNKYKDRVRETDKTRDSGRFIVRDRYRENDKYKENEKGRGNDRYSDRPRYYDKFSTRDKHDPHYRYRKQSPDRARKRSYREYQDDYYKPEYEKKKPEYERKKPELPQRNTYHEDDRHKHHYEERHIIKTYDETNKRQKTDTQIHLNQDKMCDDNKATEYDMLQASCQSPDTQGNTAETHPETMNMHIIKEIKNTAAIPLEDPRVVSKKYILKSDSGKLVLYTVMSQNIELKPVDKSLWNVQSVAIPDALLCTPVTNTDDNLKDIISVERQHCNESGEIYCDSEIESNTNVREIVAENTITEKLSKNKSEASNPKSNEICVEKNKTGYRIPKLKKSKRKSDSRSLDNSKDDFVDKTPKQVTNNTNHDTNSPKQEKHNIKQDTNILHLNLPHINVSEDVPVCELKKSCCNKSCEQQNNMLSNMAMVQDDLELSDETSDYIDKMELKEKTAEVQRVDKILDNTSTNTKAHVETISEEIFKSSEITNKQGDNKTKDYDAHKKHKSKRKKTKSKEIELGENTETTTEKKKHKKDRDLKSKEIRSTFSDLFGDSSSLITPEDLGIPASCLPISEDVQDAMDINIKDVMKSPLPGPDTDKGVCTSPVSEKTHDIDVNNRNIKDITKIEEKTEYRPSSPQTILAYPQFDTNIVNLNLHQDLIKPDIVKTVIISSGVQPQVELFQGTSEKRVVGVEVNIQKIANSNEITGLKDIKKPASKALATSTPYKEVSTQSEASSLTEDCLSDSNYSNSESKDRMAATSQLVTNTQSTYDPPDVRIFVKRRRKGVKRT